MSEDLPVTTGESASFGPIGEDDPGQRERQARVILDEMDQFVALLDPLGNLLEASRPALEGAGSRREAIVGRPFSLLDVWRVSPEVPGRIEQAVRDAAAGRIVRFETEIFGAGSDAVAITLDFSLKPVLDGQGRVAYLLAEGRNITEKTLAEIELARRAEELRALNDRLRDFDRLKAESFAKLSHEQRPQTPARATEYANADPEAPLVLVVEDNPEISAFVAETLSAGHRVVVASDGREGLERALALRPDLIVSGVMMPGLGGDDLVHEVRGRKELERTPILLLTDKADEALRVRLLNEGAQDSLEKPISPEELKARAGRLIEERRRSILAQQEAHRLLRVAVEGVTDAVFVKDLQGRYLLINSAGAGLLGRRVEEVLGKDDTEFFTPDTARRIMDEDRRVMSEGKVGTYEEIGTAAGVTRTYLSTKAPYRDHRGKVIGVLGISRDISHRKQAEDELRRSKESAEAALRAKEDFLAVLSHELRTPLTPVLAAASALHARPDLPADLSAEIGVILRNVEHEARLIDDLLDLTDLLRGDVRLHIEEVDAHALLNSTLDARRPSIEARGLEIALALEAERHHVRADPIRLRQVLGNLMDNAARFSLEGDRITLRSSNDAGRLVIQVVDTGQGIDPEALPKIFDAFEQAGRTVRGGQGGLGLGLSLSKRLVEMHRGRLWAASEGEGRGATFTLELAALDAAPGQAPAASSAARAGRQGLSILLVEDHEDTLRVLARLLERMGYRVRAARTVGEALELAAGERFDLLLSDLNLPDGSGLDVMRSVKERYGLRGIALSGFGREADIQRSRDAGFETHLTKPVDFQVLKRKIDSVGP